MPNKVTVLHVALIRERETQYLSVGEYGEFAVIGFPFPLDDKEGIGFYN